MLAAQIPMTTKALPCSSLARQWHPQLVLQVRPPTRRFKGKGIACGAGQFVEYDINEVSKGTWMAPDGKMLIIWEDGSTDEYTYVLNANGLVLRGNGREIVYRRG